MIVLNIGLILVALVCLAYILRMKFLTLYSREKFAFFIVTAGTTLISQYLFQGGAVQADINAAINTPGFMLRIKIVTGQLTISDQLISSLLIAGFIWVTYGIFLNWNRKTRDDDKKL